MTDFLNPTALTVWWLFLTQAAPAALVVLLVWLVRPRHCSKCGTKLSARSFGSDPRTVRSLFLWRRCRRCTRA